MVKLFFFYICLPNHDDDDRQCGDVGGENVDILDLCHRFLIAMMMKIMMTDSGDVGGENVDIVDLCLRSLIDPGRWRAPARSSWSPFFINNSETTKAPKIHPSLQKSWLFKDDSGDITPDRVHSPVFNRLSDPSSKGGSRREIGRSRLFSKRRPETH